MPATRDERDEETRRRALAELDALHNDSLVNAGMADVFNSLLRPGTPRWAKLIACGVAFAVIAYVVFGIARAYL